MLVSEVVEIGKHCQNHYPSITDDFRNHLLYVNSLLFIYLFIYLLQINSTKIQTNNKL